MTLLELAERCEKASGSDRTLDDLIVDVALFEDEIGDRDPTPRFTTSLDAAMTLYVNAPERVPSNPRLAAAEALRQRAEAE